MAFTPRTWIARIVQYPGRTILTPTGNTNEYDLTRSEGNITQEGDLVSAENLNDLESRISSEFATKNQPNGYAGLDEHGNLKQMPTAVDTGASAARNATKAEIDDIALPAGIYSVNGEDIGNGYSFNTVIKSFPRADGYQVELAIPFVSGNYSGMFYRISIGATWGSWQKPDADKADYASNTVALTTAGLRNAIIIPESTTIPTGLADGTIILKYTP